MAEECVFELLAAPAARPAAEEGLDLYDGLIGSWDIVSTWFRGGAAVSSRRGQWHFARILGGRGVQDILFAEGAPPEERGTTLRCYDASIKAWRVAWMMPSSGEFAQLVGRREGGRIVQEGAGAEPGGRLRWSFAELEPGSFLWLGELSRDGGATWELEQEMRAARRPEAGPAAAGGPRDYSSL
ncbi:MAG TPA: hypothetical protein PLB91_08525 [Spirochaetales bacterium]|nr:hypothetical protein [Spirochaetales bacterium]HRY53532.1 hypothetical protein [Spirochaetia bacterium]HRZ63898.1 hypothetical protein [Spirochaetia bacterium]